MHFDPVKIDSTLAELGQQPWRGERPVVVPMLLVQGRKPPAYVLSAEVPAGEEQIFRQCRRRVRHECPNAAREAELAAWGVAVAGFPFPKAAPPSEGLGEAVVAGTLEWSETTPGWIGSWRIRWRGADHVWGIRGVNYDAAFRDIIRGVVLLASGRGAPD